jgi:cell division protein FtsB
MRRKEHKGFDRKMYRGSRRVKRNFWLFLSTIFLLWMMYLFIGGDYGLLKVISLKRNEIQLRRELLRLRARREVLLSETKRLKDDPRVIEKIAREELGMIKQGETRYQFPEHFEP